VAESHALETFFKLIAQVAHVEGVARGLDEDQADVASTLRRSAYVLGVAALDTYFHERAVGKLVTAAAPGAEPAARVASYLGGLSAEQVSGGRAEQLVRLRVGYKTLVSPQNIDKLLTACGDMAENIWTDHALALGSRPDRERRALEVIYDRRNQIAHEGDWDNIDRSFRPMSAAHLQDCVAGVSRIAQGFDVLV